MPASDERHQVDFAWFRHHLLKEILPAWRAAITAEGLFACHFAHDWTPQAKDLAHSCRSPGCYTTSPRATL